MSLNSPFGEDVEFNPRHYPDRRNRKAKHKRLRLVITTPYVGACRFSGTYEDHGRGTFSRDAIFSWGGELEVDFRIPEDYIE